MLLFISVLDAQDKEGNTPLHLATENNHVQVIQELLGAGASSSILNGVGQGPIHVAVVHNRTECLTVSNDLVNFRKAAINIGGDIKIHH